MLKYYNGATFLRIQKKDEKIFGYISSKAKNTLEKLVDDKIIDRIWENDYTVWNDNPDEISNRLGWLNCPKFIHSKIREIDQFVKSVLSDNITNVLLLGMGGSSLAPEMFSEIYGSKEGHPRLFVLDSTDPRSVKKYSDKLDPSETIYIVSTKSGGTVETLSFMKYFFKLTADKLGKENAGKHFVAITDPGSKLEIIANELKFRNIFINDPNIGGRYSALSLFGIVPAAIIGMDIKKLLNSADYALENSKLNTLANESLLLGTIIGHHTKEGQDKLTFVLSESIKEFGAWAEQLIAESTGKDNTGIVPIDLEKPVMTEHYQCDRLFVFIRLQSDNSFNLRISELKTKKFNVVEIVIEDIYDLGSEIIRWEISTILASHILKIHPFNQPNVESAKIAARDMMSEYSTKGVLPGLAFAFEDENFMCSENTGGNNCAGIIDNFIANNVNNSDWCVGRSYIAMHAFMFKNEEINDAFQNLRTTLLTKYNIATTFGYGPRFLHSTGQLHKGDRGNGIFLQFFDETKIDIDIPEDAESNVSDFSFRTLITAQLLGDRKALLDNKRKVISIKVKKSISKQINKISDDLLSNTFN